MDTPIRFGSLVMVAPFPLNPMRQDVDKSTRMQGQRPVFEWAIARICPRIGNHRGRTAYWTFKSRTVRLSGSGRIVTASPSR